MIWPYADCQHIVCTNIIKLKHLFDMSGTYWTNLRERLFLSGWKEYFSQDEGETAD